MTKWKLWLKNHLNPACASRLYAAIRSHSPSLSSHLCLCVGASIYAAAQMDTRELNRLKMKPSFQLVCSHSQLISPFKCRNETIKPILSNCNTDFKKRINHKHTPYVTLWKNTLTWKGKRLKKNQTWLHPCMELDSFYNEILLSWSEDQGNQ